MEANEYGLTSLQSLARNEKYIAHTAFLIVQICLLFSSELFELDFMQKHVSIIDSVTDRKCSKPIFTPFNPLIIF